jgi:hypothetical protein
LWICLKQDAAQPPHSTERLALSGCDLTKQLHPEAQPQDEEKNKGMIDVKPKAYRTVAAASRKAS